MLHQGRMANRGDTPVTSWGECSWLEDLLEETRSELAGPYLDFVQGVDK